MSPWPFASCVDGMFEAIPHLDPPQHGFTGLTLCVITIIGFVVTAPLLSFYGVPVSAGFCSTGARVHTSEAVDVSAVFPFLPIALASCQTAFTNIIRSFIDTGILSHSILVTLLLLAAALLEHE